MTVTIQQVVDKLIEPVGRLEMTVDKLEPGNPETEVSGVGVTFLLTQEVLEDAIKLGINLIISHEGPFYSHHDQKDALAQNAVYLEKRRLLEESGIAVFRCHDYVHRYKPDGITQGLVEALQWQSNIEEILPAATVVSLPPMTVEEIAAWVKSKLGVPFVRVTGNASNPVSRVGVAVGYRGGGSVTIPLFAEKELDLIIAGEGQEWEAPEYVRDATHQGRNKTMLFIGHGASEEPGMERLAEWLQEAFPAVPVHFLAQRPLFRVL
ncbi:Nif3-like dinuclear metal center hexameric protein [Gorillibacterium massiliense]|uniref:Nif3-like dinuclear metal center hexameric protein n=1 Tax=Gorillibacterium massiliense TaxID=1280390 RepID=UPI0004B6DFA4|nr:Nif3-like dinuclear metal center hexameric protein [Gorillibacterium massiliense]